MTYILSERGRSRLQALLTRPTLYAFDFDGTLARIVRERHAARLAPDVRKWLVELGRLVPTAVISGRSVDDLRERLGLDLPYLIGNHGMEGPDTSPEMCRHAQEICEEWRRQLQGAASAQLADVGVQVEDKGYSLTFHYRLSPQKPKARSLLFHWIERLAPAPRLVLGKAVMNCIPPGVPHKGTALLALIEHVKAEQALYVGDDDTDEDVFVLPDPRLLTVRVGIKRTSQAQFYVRTQGEMAVLLEVLVRQLTGARPASLGS